MEPMHGTDIRKVEGTECIDLLSHLYRSLDEHQAGVAPTLGHMSRRSVRESWERRRRAYATWLAVPGAYVLLAEREQRVVGYALVTLAPAYHGWRSGERVAELKDVVVEAQLRGNGIGSALLDAVERELAGIGVAEYRVNVLAGNEDAARLYRARGMTQVSTVFLARVSR